MKNGQEVNRAYSTRMARFGLLTAVAVVSMAQTPAEFAVSEIAGRCRSKNGLWIVGA